MDRIEPPKPAPAPALEAPPVLVKPLPPAELVPEAPALLPEATVDSDDEDFESFLAEDTTADQDTTGPPPLPAPETYSAITPRGGPLAAVPELPEPAEASELPAPVVPKPATPSRPIGLQCRV